MNENNLQHKIQINDEIKIYVIPYKHIRNMTFEKSEYYGENCITIQYFQGYSTEVLIDNEDTFKKFVIEWLDFSK